MLSRLKELKVHNLADLKFGGELAVRCRSVTHFYGSNNDRSCVLRDLSLNVPRNSIYGLLGPSGCGKTSILKIICGLLKPENGFITVFGYKPGDPRSGCPGSGIGYMPQDTSLQTDMTVEEMLFYFGRLNFMSAKAVREQIDYLIDILNIPGKGRYISQLSGGEQRRVSFACTVIHKPRLCILDEPTVGVDPLLCQQIWKMLSQFCCQDNMTIIITTHYIQECRQADRVGFMRKGALLDEGSPTDLTNRFGTNNFEQIFLNICCAQKEVKHHSIIPITEKPRRKSNASIFYRQSIDDAIFRDSVQPFYNPRDRQPMMTFFIALYVLTWRFFLQSIREPSSILLLLVFPTLGVAIINQAIGQTPEDLQIAWVVNEKINYKWNHILPNETRNYDHKVPFYPDLIKQQIPSRILRLIDYSDLDSALADVASTKVKAAVHFGEHFSKSFQQRVDTFGGDQISMRQFAPVMFMYTVIYRTNLSTRRFGVFSSSR